MYYELRKLVHVALVLCQKKETSALCTGVSPFAPYLAIDGTRYGCPSEPIMLKPDNNNSVSWMYIEEEQCRVIRGLDSLAKQGRISWGVYTTIGKRVAFDIPEQLLLRQGSVRFVMSRGHPPRSMLIGAARWLWFLTQAFCEFDNSVGAAICIIM